jgi:hypothetical protein
MKSSRLYPKERRACKLVSSLYLVSLTNLCRFLWVKFQLDDLCRAETDNSMRKVLRNLPRDLGETYDRLLARIDVAEQRQYIKRMFSWIICARRPLEVEELREAIAFTLEDDHFDPSKIPNDLGRLARACGNLIVIDDDDNTVQIAHYTVEQYLLTKQGCQPSFFHFTREQANLEVGNVCLAYLSFPDFVLQLKKYNNAATSHLAALENVVRKESMLPPNSQAAKLVKALKRSRGNQGASTNIEFARHLSGPKWRDLPATLKVKYHALSYVAENWLHHTTMTREGWEISPPSLRYVHLFDVLALEKEFPFDIRPWDSVPLQWQGFPFILQLGWAISTNHLPLLRAIVNREANCRLNLYLERATKAYTAFVTVTFPIIHRCSLVLLLRFGFMQSRNYWWIWMEPGPFNFYCGPSAGRRFSFPQFKC